MNSNFRADGLAFLTLHASRLGPEIRKVHVSFSPVYHWIRVLYGLLGTLCISHRHLDRGGK